MDIREILKALDEKDRKLWSECRTAMRKVYLTAHNKVLGLANYEAQDDTFLDMIDIKLATLFDRGGRVNSSSTLTGDDAVKIEEDLNLKDQELKKQLHKAEMMINSKNVANLPMNEWK